MYKNYLLTLISVLFLFSCEKDPGSVHINKIEGQVQKGPFNNGTSVGIIDLSSSFNQTGLNYSTEITDETGKFSIQDIQLSSKHPILEASGFYFNECTGQNSEAPLTLSAIADINDNNLNINILSHLEKDRVLKLIDEGLRFKKAKIQAQQEILKVFEMGNEDISNSEYLDITQDGDDNAILLAISTIMQNGNSTADLSLLIADLKSDLLDDGTLDNAELGNQLISQAAIINLAAVRANLESKYETVSESVSIPDFEKYVQQFVQNTKFEVLNDIMYPDSSDRGLNILADKTDTVYYNVEYAMNAKLTPASSIKIKMKNGFWGYNAMPNPPEGWSTTRYTGNSQTFTSNPNTLNCDLTLLFMARNYNSLEDHVTIEYYENNSEEPTKTKTLVVLPEPPKISDAISAPKNGNNGYNILHLDVNNVEVHSDTSYSMDLITHKNKTLAGWVELHSTYYHKVSNILELDTNNIKGFSVHQKGDDIQFSFVSKTPQNLSIPIKFKHAGELRGWCRVVDSTKTDPSEPIFYRTFNLKITE